MNRFVKDAIYGGLGGVLGAYMIGKVMGLGGKLQPEQDKKLQQEPVEQRFIRHAGKTNPELRRVS